MGRGASSEGVCQARAKELITRREKAWPRYTDSRKRVKYGGRHGKRRRRGEQGAESAFAVAPFPFSKCVVRNGLERSRARRFCAAERTLDGEDRSGRWNRRERGRGRRGIPRGVWGRAPMLLVRTNPLANQNSPLNRRSSQIPAHSRKNVEKRFPSSCLHSKLWIQRHVSQSMSAPPINCAAPVGLAVHQ
jgi:hypothetical protein